MTDESDLFNSLDLRSWPISPWRTACLKKHERPLSVNALHSPAG
jgi:hypothetical protein